MHVNAMMPTAVLYCGVSARWWRRLIEYVKYAWDSIVGANRLIRNFYVFYGFHVNQFIGYTYKYRFNK